MTDAALPRYIAPGATLGVLGGGQLGRMFAHAAQQMGYSTAVLDADDASPAGLVSHTHLRVDYLDAQALAQLGAQCAAVTTEFENVPADALRRLARATRVAPSGDAVTVCQDRLAEKAHFVQSGVPCAAHAAIASAQDVDNVNESLFPAILKTARLGYDGKGQVRVERKAELAAAWQSLKNAVCILEQRLTLSFEISVIIARGIDGHSVHLPVQQNLHRDGILAVTQVPAPRLNNALQAQAIEAARNIASTLNYVGVLCVEFFVTDDGRLIANEMAPRPHNSGHYSIDACDVSQFDLQVRTMTHAPLTEPRLHSPAVMLNLLGDLWFEGQAAVPREPPWDQVLALTGVHLHLYGKREARPGRKMGHLTVTASTAEAAHRVALQAAALLGLPAF